MKLLGSPSVGHLYAYTRKLAATSVDYDFVSLDSGDTAEDFVISETET